MGAEPRYFDPEAIEEVDFGRYVRLLGAYWWVVAAGLVLGGIAGFAIALGHEQVYRARASLYLGEPYGASGNIALQALQTDPSALDAIVHSLAIDQAVASACNAGPGRFAGGISTQAVAGTATRNQQTAYFTLSVLAASPKFDACAANGLAATVVRLLGRYASSKIALFQGQLAADAREISRSETTLSGTGLPTADKLLVAFQLRSFESDQATLEQLLEQAVRVERPRILDRARAERVTARTARSSVLVAGLLGAIGGMLLVLTGAAIQRRRAGSA